MLTKKEKNLSTLDIKRKIKEVESLYENNHTEITYLKLLLKYKYTEEKLALSNLIKNKLIVNRVSGTFTKEETASALGLSIRQVETIEKRTLAKLKSPAFGRKLKESTYN